MKPFVPKDSIVRRIWGNGDVILFIFAGAAAEFALNKAVDWLYYTGKLPADPLGRLFSTVDYARMIVFADEEHALRAIRQINQIHASLEQSRGFVIPDWAYRDVLYMLIAYSIRAWEVLEHPLSDTEKEELFRVFRRIGAEMGLKDLPESYSNWLQSRQVHLEQHLLNSAYTRDLFRQYRKHLGPLRYLLLRQAQDLLLPAEARQLLGRRKAGTWIKPLLGVYRLLKKIKIGGPLKYSLMPASYKERIRRLDLAA